jgi:hypothetical protein
VQWWEEKECQLFPTGAALQNEDPDLSVRNGSDPDFACENEQKAEG